ncbi:MAG: EAL domain-containing protein, partial [Clostridia bacterium]
GIYNKAKFFEATREMIDDNPKVTFAFLRFDVDRFQLINTFFGIAEGDRLLKYIATKMAEDAQKCKLATYGRISGDIVALCVPYEKEKIENMVKQSKKTLASYNINYDIVPSVGIYVINDTKISIDEMFNRATLAAKTCKGNYVKFFAYYNEKMGELLTAEQEITNDMNYALESGQFEVYLQPQYNIHTNLPCGAEALVRWIHPQKGMLSPASFIPVFERNGFITKLDHYVWEQVCKYLCERQKKEITPYPISVNVSRVNIYNPNLVESLLALVSKYNIAPSLLHLELTESAYTDNPVAMKNMMTLLQRRGFVIIMDDFGSGYSSLSLLKDINIDVLKIDMKFLTTADNPGRGENIVASIIRMTKWLNIPVIAEGAETAEQVDFLRSVGCDYVQGYFFARPMPVKDYEILCANMSLESQYKIDQTNYHYDDLFDVNPEVQKLFSNTLQPVVVYEFANDDIEIIRVNEAYHALLGHDETLSSTSEILDFMDDENKTALLNAFNACIETKNIAECEYMRQRKNTSKIWIHCKLKYVSSVADKNIIVGELTDITMRKELDEELRKYRTSLLTVNHNINTVLIVDDVAINRIVLKKILQDKFAFLEAENGKEALDILKQNQVDLILLDISMPVMDGKEFLQYKKNCPELDGTPVIMITADDSPEQQISTFTLGANDYIVKPFIPEVVNRRVSNVLESMHRFKKMVKEYNTMAEQAKTDLMTGLTNRASAEEMITHRLKNTENICTMMMLDIDNFKKINDTQGHDYGDKVICAVADKLRATFRKKDLIARMGGDEFAVFIDDIPRLDIVESKAQQLCKAINEIVIDGEETNITCSVGIAHSSAELDQFELLYQNADKALYNSKCHGRNTISVFGDLSVATSINKWINDVDSVIDSINDSIYVCDKQTFELLYANDNLCNIMGVSREECKGKKCYEVLMRRNTPCDFCSIAKMEQNKVYTRLFRMPKTQEIFLMRGKTINRSGTDLHLEVAVDITEVVKTMKVNLDDEAFDNEKNAKGAFNEGTIEDVSENNDNKR